MFCGTRPLLRKKCYRRDFAYSNPRVTINTWLPEQLPYSNKYYARDFVPSWPKSCHCNGNNAFFCPCDNGFSASFLRRIILPGASFETSLKVSRRIDTISEVRLEKHEFQLAGSDTTKRHVRPYTGQRSGEGKNVKINLHPKLAFLTSGRARSQGAFCTAAKHGKLDDLPVCVKT